MPLQGYLHDVSLGDLVQVISRQNKTGLLRLWQSGQQGQLYFKTSGLYAVYTRRDEAAESGWQEGQPALYNLLDWSDGQFTFEIQEYFPANVSQNIVGSWDYIYLEYCRQQDQARHEAQLTQLANLRPTLLDDPTFRSQIKLSLDEWQILLQIDGRSTLAQIAGRINRDLAEVDTTVKHLARLGLLKLNLDETRPYSLSVASSSASQLTHQVAYNQPPLPKLAAPDPARYLTIPASPRQADRYATEPVYATPTAPINPTKPKLGVRKGLLSMIMTKIHSL